MKKSMTAVLAVLFGLLLVCMAFAVPSGNIREDAMERYQESSMEESDDSWLLNY